MKKKKLILIGASTGGPGHLEKILSALPNDFSATLMIAQHIAPVFLPSLVKSLNARCAVEVIQADEQMRIEGAVAVFVSEDITDLCYDPLRGLMLQRHTQTGPYQPCIDFFFSSACKLNGHYDILACLLTGIGDDGAQGMLALNRAGAVCVSENEQSSIVYGMPKAAYDIGASSQELSLDQIISMIVAFQ